jgi:hypothetical protein
MPTFVRLRPGDGPATASVVDSRRRGNCRKGVAGAAFPRRGGFNRSLQHHSKNNQTRLQVLSGCRE